jgi:hypothetical protein
MLTLIVFNSCSLVISSYAHDPKVTASNIETHTAALDDGSWATMRAVIWVVAGMMNWVEVWVHPEPDGGEDVEKMVV